jgi:hypothetical protein
MDGDGVSFVSLPDTQRWPSASEVVSIAISPSSDEVGSIAWK